MKKATRKVASIRRAAKRPKAATQRALDDAVSSLARRLVASETRIGIFVREQAIFEAARQKEIMEWRRERGDLDRRISDLIAFMRPSIVGEVLISREHHAGYTPAKVLRFGEGAFATLNFEGHWGKYLILDPRGRVRDATWLRWEKVQDIPGLTDA